MLRLPSFDLGAAPDVASPLLGVAVDPDALLSEIDAASLLGLSPRTLQSWRLEGDGPPIVRLGGKLVKYRRRDLLAWIAANTERPSSERQSNGESSDPNRRKPR